MRPSGVGARTPIGSTLRIDRFPLPRPVVAHGVVTAHDATLPAVRPLDVGVHAGQRAVDVARVERLVGALEQSSFGVHQAPLESMRIRAAE